MKNNLLAAAGAITVIVVVVAVFIVVMLMLVLMTRVKTCPPDKVLVVYGKNRKNLDGTYKSSKCVHGGLAFIVPFVQKYTYLDLTPLSISVDLKSALSKQNIRIDVPCIFTVGISTDSAIMQNAAERLLGLTLQNISDLAKDIIFGQLRLVIATMEIEEINTDRDKFLDAISRNVEGELKKIGLKLINVNVTDISDESGYIIALGKEAAAKAINDARISVAEEDKKGSIGQANAKMQERISVAEAESAAIAGENKAKGEADAIYAKMEAEARGIREKLSRQAEGLADIVKASGTADEAVRLMITEKLEDIVAEQVKAISNLKIDKVTVWDNGCEENGKTSTANFLSGMLKSLPPLEEVYNMAGLSLPKIVAPRKVDEKDGQGSAGAEQADVKADSAAETAEGANPGTKSGAEGANPQKDNK